MIKKLKIKMENKNSLKILGFIVTGALVLTAAFFILNKKNTGLVANFDTFAQCLADKSVTMYGTEWCVYCQKEKALFGNSFRLVPYVDCGKEPGQCTEKKIEATPTWVFPDNKRLVGLQSLEKLSQESGCPLP